MGGIWSKEMMWMPYHFLLLFQPYLLYKTNSQRSENCHSIDPKRKSAVLIDKCCRLLRCFLCFCSGDHEIVTGFCQSIAFFERIARAWENKKKEELFEKGSWQNQSIPIQRIELTRIVRRGKGTGLMEKSVEICTQRERGNMTEVEVKLRLPDLASFDRVRQALGEDAFVAVHEQRNEYFDTNESHLWEITLFFFFSVFLFALAIRLYMFVGVYACVGSYGDYWMRFV